MESLNKVFTEEQVNDASVKILKASITKITDELQGKFSEGMESWIYEHYLNSKSKIEGELIKDVTEEFIQNPMQYKFAKLREKLFLENKDLLTKTLTDEAIMLSVENVIENYTHRNYQFEWRWKDAIVQIIGNNWYKFKDDERVNNGLLRQIENLKSRVNSLQHKIMDTEKTSLENEITPSCLTAVMPHFIPQPSEIEALMKEKLANRKIDDEFGWTGEWRMSAKDVLDVIIDLQNEA